MRVTTKKLIFNHDVLKQNLHIRVPPTCLLGEQRHIWMGVLFQEHDDDADDDNVSSENNDDEIPVKFTYSHS
jgi:hypothetical protein